MMQSNDNAEGSEGRNTEQGVAAPIARPDPLARATDLARHGDLQEAASAYRAYLMRNPEDLPARRGLASVLEQKGDYVGALGELGRAIDAKPDDVSLLC